MKSDPRLKKKAEPARSSWKAPALMIGNGFQGPFARIKRVVNEFQCPGGKTLTSRSGQSSGLIKKLHRRHAHIPVFDHPDQDALRRPGRP